MTLTSTKLSTSSYLLLITWAPNLKAILGSFNAHVLVTLTCKPKSYLNNLVLLPHKLIL